MFKIKAPFVAAIGALILVGVLFLSFVLSSSAYRTGGSGIVLPSEIDPAPVGVEDFEQKNKEILMEITITPQNVQQVIAALSRPQSYTMTVSSTLYTGASSGKMVCCQTFKNDAVRVDYLTTDGGVERTVLFWQDACYAWRAGAVSFYKGTIGSFSQDGESMLPSYETVCSLAQEQILSAALTEEEGDPCVSVVAQEGEYTVTYVVSAASGLLRRAVYEQQGAVVRTVETTVSLDAPDDSLFILPGTTQVIFNQTSSEA